MRTALQLRLARLRQELQVHLGRAPPPCSPSRVHAGSVNVHIQAAPLGARRTPDEQVGATSTKQSECSIA
eukprot:5984350-Alexandrium_andersonii.AAC.1